MSQIVRPMKADNKEYDLTAMLEKTGHLRAGYLLASYKMDGIRAFVKDGVVWSNSLKRIPSKFVQDTFSSMEGFDGELICGEPNDSDVYTKTFSAVMTHNAEVPVCFWVFDMWNLSDHYKGRLGALRVQTRHNPRTIAVSQYMVTTEQEILSLEAEALSLGYEGLMLRRPDSPYKFGRSTNLQGHLIKLKRVQDAEAKIIGFEELMHNANEPTVSALGYTTRTSHKANKEGMDTLGALIVKGITPPFADVEFKVGVFKGFSKSFLQDIWKAQKDHLGKIIRYQYFGIGVKDAPRHPRMTGFRAAIDL